MNLFELAAKITLNADDYEKGIKAAMQLGDKAAEGMKRIAENSETVKNKIKVLSAQYDSAKDNVKKLTKEFNESVKANGETSDKTKELAKALDKAEKEADQFGKELDQMQNSSEGAKKGFSGLTEKAEKFSAWAVAKGALIAEGIKKAASAVIDFGKSAVEAGMSFEAQMSKVGAISGATAKEMEMLNAKAEEMGNKTQFSATEAGQAFEYMAMAGWKTHDMMNGIEGIMNLAAASGEDLASVSDIVTDALTAFGMKAEESAYFADVLATASSSSNTNVGMMGETFKYVAPVAGALGYRIDDVAIAIGLMANANVKGSQAGTALRSILTRLVKPTKEVGEAAAKLGISLEGNNSLLIDEKGEMRDFFTVLVTLRKAFSNLTETEKAETAAKLAGQEAMAGMLTIVNASEEDFWKLSEAIGEADGASEKMAETMLNNLQGQMTMLSSSTESFQLALYNHVKQPLTEMAAWAVESLNGITEAFKSGGFTGMVQEFGNVVVDALSNMMEEVPHAAEIAVELVGTLAKGLADGIPEIVPNAVEVILSIAETFVDHLDEIWDSALEIITALGKGLVDSIPELATKVPEIIGGIVGFLLDHLPDIFAVGWDIIVELAKGIVEHVPDLLDSATEMIDKICEGLANGLEKIKDMGSDVVDKIQEGIESAWNGFVNWWTNLWNSVFGNKDINVNINASENLSNTEAVRGPKGSHAGGLAYVPVDGYRAILHKGERVLTAEENKSGGKSGVVINQYIQTIPQTPVEMAAAMTNRLEEMRWAGAF